ncbi:MAG: glycosyltransferase [Proteobacteria bacterium]|nr:glycosyltransferase [Pseudomonadota bacterium]
MRILHVTRTYYPDTRGGIEEVIRQIALNTKNLGIETRVFTLSKIPIPRVIEVDGIKIYRAPLTVELASCGISINSLKLFRELANWAQIINYHFPWPFMDILNLLTKTRAKKVVTYHSDIVRQKNLFLLYMPLMKHFLKQANIIVATSDNYVKSSKYLHKYKEKVKVIPLGINKQSIPQPTKKEYMRIKNLVGQDFFLFVGTLRKYKGLEFLLKALVDEELKFVIAGSGPELKTLQGLAKKLKLKNIIFMGRVNDSEKASLLSLCCSVVLPSHLRSEAFGMTLLEGAIFKKPLISTELKTGTSYLNVNGVTGIVVPRSDSNALRESMLLLKNNKDLAKIMGEAAFERYKKFFKGTSMSNQYVKIYKQFSKDDI